MTSLRSSGSMRTESVVEPTESEKITVTWRRSARSSGRAPGTLDAVAASTEGSFRFSCVRLGRTVSSMSFSRKIVSYLPRPRLRSQTTMSIGRPSIRGGAHHLLGRISCLGRSDYRVLLLAPPRRLDLIAASEKDRCWRSMCLRWAIHQLHLGRVRSSFQLRFTCTSTMSIRRAIRHS
jgi:hypothetical protein